MPSAMANSERFAISSAVYSPTNRLVAPQVGRVDRKVVDERPHRRRRRRGDPRSALKLSMTTIAGSSCSTRRVISVSVSATPLASDHGAEVGEDDLLLVDQLLVEEGELLHVAEELQRRLGQRRQVEALLALPRLVEEHLQREDRLAGARLSGDHVDRARSAPRRRGCDRRRRCPSRGTRRRGRSALNWPPRPAKRAQRAELGDLLQPADDDRSRQFHAAAVRAPRPACEARSAPSSDVCDQSRGSV